MGTGFSAFASLLALLVPTSVVWAQAEGAQAPQPIQIMVAVRNTHGKPVSGAVFEVKLAPLSEDDKDAAVPFHWQTDATGKGTLKVSRPGLARITVTAPPYLPTVVEDVVLKDASEVTVELERGGSLKGKAQDADGKGYPGVSVLVLKADDDDAGPRKFVEIRAPVRTGPDGSFAMEDLSSGFYTVILDEEPGEPPVVELAGAVSPAHVTEDGLANTVMLVRLLGTIQGAVELPFPDVPGAVLITPVPAAAALFDEDYVKQHQVSVPTNGVQRVPFALRGLASGGYRVEFEAEGYAPLLSSDKVFLPTGASVEFPPQFMDRGVQVEGTLRTRESERPIAKTDVLVFFPSLDVPIMKATSSDDGSLRLGRLAPGNYVVRASSAGLLPLEETVKVEKGTTKARFDLRFRSGAVVEGSLVDDGKPQAGVEVMLTAAGDEGRPGGFSRMQTDAQGRFRFGGMPAGRYALLAPALGILQEFTLGEDERQTIVVEARNARRLR